VDPKIVTRDAFSVIGLMDRFTDEDGDVGGLWNRFMSFHDQIQPLSTDKVYYGVAFTTEEEDT